MMPWYQKYIEDRQWHQFYKDEAHRKLGKVITDWENCYAEAAKRLLVDKLPNVTLAHKGNKDGYVASVYRRILEDIRREHCGRPRPPAEMIAEGPPITRIFDLHCLQQLEPDEISRRLDLPLAEVKYWTRKLTAEKKCPETITLVSTSQSHEDNEYTINLPASDSLDPIGEEQVELETNALLEMIFEVGQPSAELKKNLTANSQETLSALSDLLNLSDQDRLLFRLRYFEGLSKSKAAKQLGIATATLNKREKERLSYLKETFKAAGFEL